MKTKGSLRRISNETKIIIKAHVINQLNRSKTRDKMAEELESLLGNNSPSLETLKKMISEIRNTAESELDSPWCLSLNINPVYQIPAEAIDCVLEIQSAGNFKVTIRQAKWISTLYKRIKDLDLLDSISLRYSILHRMSEIPPPTPFDTTVYDKLLHNEKSQRILVSLFDADFLRNDTAKYSRAFKDSTGYEFAGVMVKTDKIYIFENKAYVLTSTGYKNLKPILETSDQVDHFINSFKEKNLFKSLEIIEQEIKVINLKKSMLMEVPKESYSGDGI